MEWTATYTYDKNGNWGNLNSIDRSGLAPCYESHHRWSDFYFEEWHLKDRGYISGKKTNLSSMRITWWIWRYMRHVLNMMRYDFDLFAILGQGYSGNGEDSKLRGKRRNLKHCVSSWIRNRVATEVYPSPKLVVFQGCHPQFRNPWLLRLYWEFEHLRLDRTKKAKRTSHIVISLQSPLFAQG